MLKIILARHAETLWNEQLRYIGRTDLDLSKLGLENARKLAEYLKETPMTAVFSSDMRRALTTAKIASGAHKIHVIEEHLLREIDFGIWEGLTYDEIIAKYPDLAKRWLADPAGVNLPEGEPVSTFAERVIRGWRDIIQKSDLLNKKTDSKAGTILIVTHAGCIKAILGHILDTEPDHWWRIHQDKGALNHIIVRNGKPSALSINDTGYRKNGYNHSA